MGGFDTQLSCFKYNLIITLRIVMQVQQRKNSHNCSSNCLQDHWQLIHILACRHLADVEILKSLLSGSTNY